MLTGTVQADMGEYAVDSVKINQIEAQLNLLNLRLHQVRMWL